MMKTSCVYGAFLIFFILATTDNSVEGGRAIENFLSHHETAEADEGKMWAVLVAGSNGYINYRHQADVCHAYQMLKKGGLKDENIIVFMYDDIAHHSENPTPGVVVNKPKGPNVYDGVIKDYTGKDVNVDNLYAVLLGNKSAVTGGSGKVLSSGPNDHVFFYYTDHGGPGILAMPNGDYVYAKDLVKVLKQKYKMKGFKRMAMYIEACESGSMVDGLLPDDIDIYTTTASKPDENSWACYCPGEDNNEEGGKANPMAASTAHPPAPTPVLLPNLEPTPVPAPAPTPGPSPAPEPGTPGYYGTCLGDMYSVAWLEDSDEQDPRNETLKQQYLAVKGRTNTSHVMEYGDMCPRKMSRSRFMGWNYTKGHDIGADTDSTIREAFSSSSGGLVISQVDAKLAYLRNKVQRAPDGSPEWLEAQKMLRDELSRRSQEDRKIGHIVKLLFGKTKEDVLAGPDQAGKPLVNDWECFKTLVRTYEKRCGASSEYGRKYTRVMAKMCNAGVSKDQFIAALDKAC